MVDSANDPLLENKERPTRGTRLTKNTPRYAFSDFPAKKLQGWLDQVVVKKLAR